MQLNSIQFQFGRLTRTADSSWRPEELQRVISSCAWFDTHCICQIHSYVIPNPDCAGELGCSLGTDGGFSPRLPIHLMWTSQRCRVLMHLSEDGLCFFFAPRVFFLPFSVLLISFVSVSDLFSCSVPELVRICVKLSCITVTATPANPTL